MSTPFTMTELYAHEVEVSLTVERGLATVRINAEDLPTVAALGRLHEGQKILAIGEADIHRGYGGNVEYFDEQYYRTQLVEAVAALHYFQTREATVERRELADVC